MLSTPVTLWKTKKNVGIRKQINEKREKRKKSIRKIDRKTQQGNRQDN